MNEILLQALANRIKAEEMTREQVPIPFQEEVDKILNPIEEEKI